MRLRIYEARTPGRCDHACTKCAYANVCDDAQQPRTAPLALMFDCALTDADRAWLAKIGVAA